MTSIEKRGGGRLHGKAGGASGLNSGIEANTTGGHLTYYGNLKRFIVGSLLERYV